MSFPQVPQNSASTKFPEIGSAGSAPRSRAAVGDANGDPEMTPTHRSRYAPPPRSMPPAPNWAVVEFTPCGCRYALISAHFTHAEAAAAAAQRAGATIMFTAAMPGPAPTPTLESEF